MAIFFIPLSYIPVISLLTILAHIFLYPCSYARVHVQTQICLGLRNTSAHCGHLAFKNIQPFIFLQDPPPLTKVINLNNLVYMFPCLRTYIEHMYYTSLRDVLVILFYNCGIQVYILMHLAFLTQQYTMETTSFL
jgi:hypothetical protein